ncbi:MULTISPECIES: hypothetical protein [unclassified Serratia (in: enterobacteria)]|uniref:hypothetical protein n=1 Tax=unclassified Serratia (in: enterobacteria) TaxID=2647522 RepID=UPI0004695766|nr:MULTISPECIES: hypothetical protein [unclassified Serratia (in: enterobacteria)]
MMEIWAKLFESNGRQVLVEKSSDDNGHPEVLFRWAEDGFYVSTGPTWKSSDDEAFDKRDKFFHTMSQETVDAFVLKIMNTINNE